MVFKVVGWGWYYLSTVMGDYSRYILSWKLSSTMSADDVKETLDMALEETTVDKVCVHRRPRLLSDNGSCYLSKDLKAYLNSQGISHTRGAPYHPMTQGKSERYRRPMKNVINLQNYYLPGELNQEIARFVDYYNNHRYHESLNNLTPADVCFGRDKKIVSMRERIKERAMRLRWGQNLADGGRKKGLQEAEVSLRIQAKLSKMH